MGRLPFGFFWRTLPAALLLFAGAVPAVSGDVATQAGDVASVQLQAIGGLSAVNAEHTYLLIVALSEGCSNGFYDTKSIHPRMNRVIRQLETCSNQLRKVQEQGLDEDDDEIVEVIISVHARLRAQARALVVFSEIGGETEARNLEKARRAARKELDEMLEFDLDEVLPEAAGSAGNS
jgi:hypothetical protein